MRAKVEVLERAGKRQAAPFARRKRVEHPQQPGRKAGQGKSVQRKKPGPQEMTETSHPIELAKRPVLPGWIRILLIIAGMSAAILLFYRPLADLAILVTNRHRLQELLLGYGAWGPVILALLFILQTFLAFIPGQVLMVASGYLYGFTGGLLVTWLSLTVSGQMVFWLTRRFGRPFVNRFVSPGVITRWDEISARQGIPFYVVTLVMPFFPNDAMCYLAGLGQIRPGNFLIANLLGRLIASLITTFVGAYGILFPWWGWLIIALAILAATLIGHSYRERLTARGGQDKGPTHLPTAPPE